MEEGVEFRIVWLKEKIEYNSNFKDMKKYTRKCIKEFGELDIPAEYLIEQDLVKYMKSVGQRFSKLKSQADEVVRKWQQEVDSWMQQKKLSEKSVKPMIDNKKLTDEKPVQPSTLCNGIWKSCSSSGYYQNSHSSSSQEVDSPDLHMHNQRNSSFQVNSCERKFSSPSQLENPSSQNINSNELKANLSIDPKEVIPKNEKQESPVKSDDRFILEMKKGMFLAVPLKKPLNGKGIENILAASYSIMLPEQHLPSFVRKHLNLCKSKDQIKVNSNSSNGTKSLNDKKNISPHSASKKELKDSSRAWFPSKHDWKRKHLVNDQSLKTQKGKEALRSINTDQRTHKESIQSNIKTKELNKEQHTAFAGKLKTKETTLSVTKAKELKEQTAQDSKLKHLSRNHPADKGKELKKEFHSVQDKMLKHKGTTQSFNKLIESKVEKQPVQDKKLNLDTKRVSAMVTKDRNCDKNNIKKRDSPDQSAMIANTSSKKERTSVYHGGKKTDSPDQSAMIAITSSKKERTSMYHGGKKTEVVKLKEMCLHVLSKSVKHPSDLTKYINKDASFENLEPLLVKMNPELLYKLEEEKKYLLDSTNLLWKFNCERTFKSRLHLKRNSETWRTFFERCRVESSLKLKNLTASINASSSKVKPDRQIKLTTVDGPPAKRQKNDFSKCNGHSSNSTLKLLPNNILLGNSKPTASVPPKGIAPVPPKSISNHIKPVHKTSKKDAPLMHKVKKTMGQLNRIHRS